MKIRLIVPVKYRGNDGTNPIVTIDPVARYGGEIAEIAGGFTATQAMGGWIDGSNLLVVEPVTVFDCHYDALGQTQAARFSVVDTFQDLARRIARELRQECVYLEIDGEVEFVKA
jgi:hypothetical protein